LNAVNISDVLGNDRDSFLIPSKIVNNRLSVATRSLIDCGADGYRFIDAEIVKLIASRLGLKKVPIKNPGLVNSFDGGSKQSASHVVFLTLQIDGHRFVNEPFLILNLGKHEVILGKH